MVRVKVSIVWREGAINIFVVCFSIVHHFYRVPGEGGGGVGWGMRDGENLAARSVFGRQRLQM